MIPVQGLQDYSTSPLPWTLVWIFALACRGRTNLSCPAAVASPVAGWFPVAKIDRLDWTSFNFYGGETWIEYNQLGYTLIIFHFLKHLRVKGSFQYLHILVKAKICWENSISPHETFDHQSPRSTYQDWWDGSAVWEPQVLTVTSRIGWDGLLG